MVVKTYRGRLADGGQDIIPLSTKDGSVGYRIKKFQIISKSPSTLTNESTIKIYKTKQTTVTGIIDFSDTDLLAVAFWSNNSGASYYTDDMTVIFDTEIVNQDIYITHDEQVGNAPCNYYLELEQVKLDHTQNMSVTLKAIRGI